MENHKLKRGLAKKEKRILASSIDVFSLISGNPLNLHTEFFI